MAFANGSITFKRLRILGASPERVDEALLKQLADRSINGDSIRTADYTEVGWVTGEHILDTAFDFEKNALGDGLHFAMRVDTNKAPTELVRSYQRMNEQSMLEASGKEFLSKAQRREAREQALSRAESEAQAGRFRRMRQVMAFWDLPRNEVYLGATGPTVLDQFILLFRETFDLSLIVMSSGEMAARFAAAVGDPRSFDDCKPVHFINPPDGAEDPTSDVPNASEARTRDYLGTEWLTWLWYTTEVESPEITTPRGDVVTVLLEKALHLDCAFKITGTTSIQAEGPTHLPEAPVALAGGKRPIRSGFQIAVHGDVYRFAVRGDAMNFTGVQLPPIEEAAGDRVLFEERMTRLRDFIDATEGMYSAFLKRRLSSKWPQTLSAMRSWVAAGGRTESVAPQAVAS